MDRGRWWGKTNSCRWIYVHLYISFEKNAEKIQLWLIAFQIQYEITRVQQKMKDLALLHDKHMNRPTLDDSSEEEHAIEITTQEITQVDF